MNLPLSPSLGDQRIGDQASDIGFIFRSLVRSRIEWIMAVAVGAAYGLRARIQRVFLSFQKMVNRSVLHVSNMEWDECDVVDKNFA